MPLVTDAETRIAGCQLFPDDGARHAVQPLAPVLSGDRRLVNAEIEALPEQVHGKNRIVVGQTIQFQRGRFEFLLCKLAHRLLNSGLVGSEFKIDHVWLLTCSRAETGVITRVPTLSVKQEARAN